MNKPLHKSYRRNVFINVDVNHIDGYFEKIVTPILTNKNDE